MTMSKQVSGVGGQIMKEITGEKSEWKTLVEGVEKSPSVAARRPQLTGAPRNIEDTGEWVSPFLATALCQVVCSCK